jgi:uncharacterized repeat protein (TIGR03803 family)
MFPTARTGLFLVYGSVLGIVGCVSGDEPETPRATTESSALAAPATPPVIPVRAPILPPGLTDFEVLHDFVCEKDGCDSTYSTLTADGMGRLYGTTVHGGVSQGGTLYRFTPGATPLEGGSFDVLHSFPAHASPVATIAISPTTGIGYGTTGGGGPYGNGALFEIGTTFFDPFPYKEVLGFHGGEAHDFLSSLVVDPAGNLYGAAWDKIAFLPLGYPFVAFSFPLPGDPNYPLGYDAFSLARSKGGSLYGLTFYGYCDLPNQAHDPSSLGSGTIFRVANGTSECIVTQYALGGFASNGLVAYDTSLFGTAFQNDGFSGGYQISGSTIFQWTQSGGLSTVYTFDPRDGVSMSGLVDGGDGHLYGITSGTVGTSNVSVDATTSTTSTPNRGVLYRYSLGTHQVEILHRFTQADGFFALSADGLSPAGLVTRVGPYIYGVNPHGGTHGAGTLWRYRLH